MTSLLEVLGAGIVVGIIPLLLGFAPSYFMGGWKPHWAPFSAGLSLGFLSLFFTDLMDDSGGLGVSSGLSVTPTQVGLVVLFFLGFALFFLYPTGRFTDQAGSPPAVQVAYLVALGMGLHALGEGMIIGNNLAGQTSIEDFSTLLQGASFALHKFLEGFTITVFVGSQLRVRNVGICAILAGLPFLFGIPMGMFTYPAILANFSFAAGAGAVVYMMTQIPRLFKEKRYYYRVVLGFLIGFLIVYFASLIHFTEVLGLS